MKIKTGILVSGLMIGSSAFATGIPVVDVASITQSVAEAAQRAADALNQLNAARQQINEVKNAAQAEKARFEGNSNLSSVLSDPTISSYLPSDDWEKVYTNRSSELSGLRAEYGLKSDDTTKQKVYDELLTNISVMQDSYDATVKRSENIKQLATYMDAAKTPQAKADYANRIAYEQTQIMNEKTKIDSMSSLMAQRTAAINKALAAQTLAKYQDK